MSDLVVYVYVVHNARRTLSSLTDVLSFGVVEIVVRSPLEGTAGAKQIRLSVERDRDAAKRLLWEGATLGPFWPMTGSLSTQMTYLTPDFFRNRV
jgi:hypothetical protein